MVTNFVSFILGACVMRFIAEKQWVCVFIILAIEALNLFAMSRSENDNLIKSKVISISAYIYVVVTDEFLSKGLDISVRKEIAKTASELPLAFGVDTLSMWMKACSGYRMKLEEKRREKNDR